MEYGFEKKLYPSQVRLIEDVINTINSKKTAIVSSPTGTGKTLSLLCALTKFLRKPSEEEDLFELFNNTSKTKIYYCSRTHSQLAQAIGELKKCKHRHRSVILGSRKMYCINKRVNQITNPDLLNEKCREMVRDNCCQYYEKKHYTPEILDIEELKSHGIKEGFCPYYYAKNQASECEMVFLPYNLLFTVEGRKSLDISLKDKIVVVDEAHNIYDAVIQLNSAEISWSTIKLISGAKGLNTSLKTIISNILAFRSKIGNESGAINECVYTVIDFIVECGLMNFNMLEIADFIEKTRMAQKNDMKCIFEFSKFLKLLTFSDQSGRVFVNRFRVKFSCMNPKMYFEELKECASVIFAGGTMEPIAHLKQIFPELLYYNYPAVNENFLSLIIPETVTGKQINTSYNYRNEQLDDVINTLVALSNPVVTGGIIIFVPSRQFMDQIKNSQKLSNFRRKVYFEGNILFENFKNEPEILIAVMNGSLSEGVNFSDDVCRLLIIVGVPYPIKTVEIAERSKFVSNYETLVAMKTVNQTVGRAVRHKNDFAAIIFLDSRYMTLKEKLSPWLCSKTKIYNFGEGYAKINTFLRDAHKKALE